MIIDFHTHIGRSRDGASQNISDTLRLMRKFNVSESFVFPIDEMNPGPSYRRLNRKIASVIKRYKNLYGCARLNPNQPDACHEEIEFAVQHGFRAVKFHPRSDEFCSQDTKPLLSAVDRHKLIVILHTDHASNCHPKDWSPFFKKYPKTFFILTHAGKDLFRQAIQAAKEFKNVYLDTSTVSYYRTGIIVKEAGFKKVVFASDIPYSHMWLEIKKFELLLSKSKQKFVFRDNAKRILES